jgi:hypothetical protein
MGLVIVNYLQIFLIPYFSASFWLTSIDHIALGMMHVFKIMEVEASFS